MAQLLSTNVYGTLSLTSTLYAPTINAATGNVYANTLLAGNDVAIGTSNIAISNGLTIGTPTNGAISVALSNYVAVLTQTANSYGGFFLQNYFSSIVSSSDIYVVTDDGSDSQYFLDMGINSSKYNDPAYSIFAPRDAYITAGGGANTVNLYMITETAGNIYLGGGGTTPGNVVISILPNTSGNGGNTIFSGTINVRSTAIVANLITTSGVFWSNGSPYSTGGGSGTPGGANTQIQFNNNGAFGGSANLTFNTAFSVFSVGTNNTLVANVANNTVVTTNIIATIANATTINAGSYVTATGLNVAVTAAVYANSGSLQVGSINFVNTSTVNVSVTAGSAGNVNVAFQGSTGSKSISIPYPSTSENVTLFYTTTAKTISKITAFVVPVSGTTNANSTFSILYGSSRTGAGTAVVTGGIVANNTTTGTITTTFNNATIPAQNVVWLTTTTANVNTAELHVTLEF